MALILSIIHCYTQCFYFVGFFCSGHNHSWIKERRWQINRTRTWSVHIWICTYKIYAIYNVLYLRRLIISVTHLKLGKWNQRTIVGGDVISQWTGLCYKLSSIRFFLNNPFSFNEPSPTMKNLKTKAINPFFLVFGQFLFSISN